MTLPLQGRRIVLALTGGIACYKSAELLRQLQALGASVQVVMTPAATRFVTPLLMSSLSGQPVFDSLWQNDPSGKMSHIQLSRQADLLLVAPASADFIARLAQGMADDLLTTLCLARECPLLLAPAMNQAMWSHPATQRNLAQVVADGAVLLGPDEGVQACGETGMGRMLEPEALVEDIQAFLTRKLLKDVRVLITAGATREAIDPVRSLSNTSSGKLGFAIARAARAAGAKVTLITGPTALETPRRVRRVDVDTAREMLDEVLSYVDHAQVFIGVAAVADWRVREPSPHKLAKEAMSDTLSLSIEANPDILATVAQLPHAPYCVGFAAETQDLVTRAQAKRVRKQVPLIVANDPRGTLGTDHAELTLIDADGVQALPRLNKADAAQALIEAIAARLENL